MFINFFFKIVLQEILWLLFASFLLLMWGWLGQCFLGQGVMLAKSQQWLHHEEIVLSNVLKNPRIVQSVETFFNQRSVDSWQSFDPANDLSKWHPVKATPKTEKLKHLLQTYYQRLQMSQQIFYNLLIVAILRLWIVLLFLPLLGLLGCVGFVDGLTQRHLRKKQAARESSVFYQRAKECLKPALFGAGVVYMGMPFSLDPQILFLVFSLLFGFTLAIAVRTYKKYL